MSFRSSFRGIIFLAILGVFCTGLAYLLYFQVLKFLVLRLHPVLRILFLCSERYGGSFLGEVITWQIGIGCVVILIASIVIFQGESQSMKIVLIRHGQTDWNKKKFKVILILL